MATTKSNTSVSETNEVTLSVEFAGVCLYVIDRAKSAGQETTVSVLIPTCVPNERVRNHHEDEDVGARHVPYLLMDLANLEPESAKRVRPGFVADGPRFQVVRRLSREELFFEPEESQGSIVQLVPDPLPLPDLSVYKPQIKLKVGLDSATPPDRAKRSDDSCEEVSSPQQQSADPAGAIRPRNRSRPPIGTSPTLTGRARSYGRDQ